VKMESLQELFVKELQDLLSAENQITKALPKMAKAASSRELKAGFEQHLDQTKRQITRLEQIFEELEASPDGDKCKGMEGLLKEGEALIDEDAEPEVLDAALIAAAQKVEHYEIASYGTVRTYANLLGLTTAADLLEQTLNEEKETDSKLTDIAGEINVQADKAA
jgi:ferritin-like metal-binding protein YciE